MQRLGACRLCGRDVVARGRPGPRPTFCKRCTAKADREAAKVLRVRCKECGKKFTTAHRGVRYCSDSCRRAAAKKQRASRRPGSGRRDGPAKCRMCGKDFAVVRPPGRSRLFCSEECRYDALRRTAREGARRQAADPKKRIYQYARARLWKALHRTTGHKAEREGEQKRRKKKRP